MAAIPVGGAARELNTGVGTSISIGPGVNPAPYDLRIIRIGVPAGVTFLSVTGFTKIHDQLVSGVHRVGVFIRDIQPGDQSTTVFTIQLSTGCIYTMHDLTVRGWFRSQTLAATTSGSGSSATNIVAPSVNTGLGILVCFWEKYQSVNAQGSANGWVLPASMATLSSGQYIPLADAGWQREFGWEPRTSGASGTRTAQSLANGNPAYPGMWTATSMFIQGIPDQTVNLGKITETNSLKAVTGAYGPITAKLGKIIETNTVRSVTNPLQSVWFSPPRKLKDVPVAGSLVSWKAIVPAGTSLEVATSVDNGGSWQVAQQGKPVPRLAVGSASERTVLARVTMRRNNLSSPMPTLIRLYVGSRLDASRDELFQQGVFTLNETDITDNYDGLTLDLAATDRSRRVSRNRWERTYIAFRGTNIGDLVGRIINNRLPGVPRNMASTDETTPGLFFGQDANNDPYEDAQKLAEAIGFEIHFDPTGGFVFRAEPDPDIDPAVWTFDDTKNPSIVSINRRVTDENTYNRVVFVGEGTELDAPVQGIAEDLDPASPTYILGDYGIVTDIVRSNLILTSTQAYEAARARLLRVKGATEAIEMDVIPMHALEPGDIIIIERSRSKISGQFIIDSIFTPIGPGELMHIVARRQRMT